MWGIRDIYTKKAFTRRARLLIQLRMGLKVLRVLSDEDMLEILSDADTSDVDQEDMENFEIADALLRVTNSDGAESMVAVEVSYTVHTDDVGRASTNARLLTEWTGVPARAAVAGAELHPAAWRACDDTGTTFLRIRPRALRGA